jgi:xylan 1,4-beta-xylosidase
VRLELAGLARVRSAHLERIDDDHANARRAWLSMGQPESLLPRQVDALEAASALRTEPVAFDVSAGLVTFDVALPPQGTALLTLEIG